MSKHAAIILLLLLFTAVPAHSQNANHISLIVSAPHEGEMLAYGLPTLRAAELAVEEYNAKGGVLGKPVRLLPFNDQCQPGTAKQLAELVQESNATLMIGPVCNGMARSILPMLNQQGVVAISPSVTAPDLTESRLSPFFFRTMSPTTAQPRTQVAFARSRGMKRIALLHDASASGLEAAAVAGKLIQSDREFTVVHEDDLLKGERLVPAVRAIVTGRTDLVLYHGERGLGSAALALLRAEGYAGAVMTGDRFWDDALLATLGTYADGLHFTGPEDVSGTPLYGQALQRFTARYGENASPGPYFFHAYAATMALLQAVEQAKSIDPYAVARMLRKHSTDTPIGTITFNPAGDVLGSGMVVYQYRNNEIREVFR